ncbi:MAG: M48 family metallopeptidase [Oscillatoriales cyanobacterium SM2_1_8]|nr:M48 family metallopeptidase [Oscillatoriales cyanobacterium SM2_1_8]
MAELGNLEVQVRESPRARRVKIAILSARQIRVTVPMGFPPTEVPLILAANRPWLERNLPKVPAPKTLEPKILALAAIGEEWHLALGGLPQENYPQLTLPHMDAAIPWLRRKAERHLIPILHQVGQETGLSFQKVAVRHQKTRWASCSGQGHISLNCKLLFLPPADLRYVLIHELCHTVHLNHSANFWALVATFLPDCRDRDRAVRKAWQYIPPWL